MKLKKKKNKILLYNIILINYHRMVMTSSLVTML